MRIDAVIDFVCPWCFIGHARLSEALSQRPQVVAEVVPRAYLLDPAVPEDGYDLRERLRKRYGVDPERMFERVEGAARESGIDLDFAGIRRYPSTLRAHALARFARGERRAEATVSEIFAAYFLRGEDIGEVPVLVRIARAAGLEENAARGALTDAGELEAVRTEADAMRRRGIDGVPFFSIDERAFIRGAEPVHAMLAAIDRATSG
jgi:predicted DsbA family dithiol-disulfide isomerase